MNIIEHNIEPAITETMSKIYSLLNKLDDENFDKIALEINSNISFLSSIKNKYLSGELSYSVSKTTENINMAKQIQKKFDNIITKKAEEIKIIGEELNSLKNKKQLTGYRV